MSSDENTTDDQKGGVFISRGMLIEIPAGGLDLMKGTLTIHVGLNMCPFWLRIACEHLSEAKARNKVMHIALNTSNDEQLGLALEKEFLAAMQAAMAAAIAIDAFYAMVKERIDIPQQEMNAWKENGTARYRQIYEVLRRAFAMGPESQKQMLLVIEQAMHFRDLAVHPAPQTAKPHFHPELERNTEWRFVTYRFQNAKNIVGTSLSLIAQLGSRPKEKYTRLKQYCEGLEHFVSPIVEEWEHEYGLLYPRPKVDQTTSN